MIRAGICAAALAVAPVSAEEVDVVKIHVSFLDAPTGWCPSDKGVPAVLTFDGPDLSVGVFDNGPTKSVKVRRGGANIEDVQVDRLDVGQVRTHRGRSTHSGQRLYPRMEEVVAFGRLRGEVDLCQAVLPAVVGALSWRIEDADGSILQSGTVEKSYYSIGAHPLIGAGHRYPRTIKLGDQTFVVVSEPEYIRTADAFVSVDEEQSQ